MKKILNLLLYLAQQTSTSKLFIHYDFAQMIFYIELYGSTESSESIKTSVKLDPILDFQGWNLICRSVLGK